jgi:hypothetical protein
MLIFYLNAAYIVKVRLSLGRFNLLVNKRIDIGLSLFNVGSISIEETVRYTFLPLKAGYRIVDYDNILGINLYWKAAWQFTQKEKEFNPFTPAPDSGFYGTAGIPLSSFFGFTL